MIFIVLARSWLGSDVEAVKLFNSLVSKRRIVEARGNSPPTSYHSIANFLSKNGKAVSYVSVKNYLDISDKNFILFFLDYLFCPSMFSTNPIKNRKSLLYK